MNSQKRVFLVHGWASSPSDSWLPWLKSELENRGFLVIAPEMPNPKYPDIPRWIDILGDSIGTPDKDTYFVGHSLGCFIILKYLESINIPVGGVVCVGGRFEKEGWPALNTDKVKKVAQKIEALFSDDDYYVPIFEAEKYKKRLNANIHILSGMGHFSRKENIKELKEARDMLLEIAV